MKKILIVGAGKTSVYLIEYLIDLASRNKWHVVVCDADIDAAKDKIGDSEHASAYELDITNAKAREKHVREADIVISLMPPSLHILLAKDCLKHKKHLITSSYVSPEMKALHEEAEKAGIMFMCEMGLDPGIDHMTAHNIIYSIHKVAGSIKGFKSYTGGLIAPESDDNPWHYKFSWNPMNVVTAGSAGAKYIEKGKTVDLDYMEVFANPGNGFKSPETGKLEHYGNRDSLKYLEEYELPEIETFLRATYRHKDFIKAWNILVQLGLTDTEDSVYADTYPEWIIAKNNFSRETLLKKQVAEKFSLTEDSQYLNMIDWLGIFDDYKISETGKSSAKILLDVLLDKWQMKEEDKDMIVMRHEILYQHRGNGDTNLSCTMVLKGENQKYSAMAKTVGLPMAILTKLLLTEKVKPVPGVQIPNIPAIYKPVLSELEQHGIVFKEEVS